MKKVFKSISDFFVEWGEYRYRMAKNRHHHFYY